MKSVNHLPLTVKRILCPFCGFGCELGIVFDDFGIKGVEYLKDTPNQGRLCPRGSASVLYLNHPKRLCVPVIDGKYKDWEFISQEFKNILQEPDTVAVTVDRNLTIEEEYAILDFCEKSKIKNIASTYFEPEALLNRFIDEKAPAGLEDIEKSEIIIVFGDVFNYAPMISKNLINWKFTDRKHRLVVIDSLKTHTSYFATDFIMVRPGTEALVSLKLGGEDLSNIKFSDITGVSEETLDNIGKAFSSSQDGLIIVSMPFAHSYEPQLVFEGIRILSDKSKKKILPIFEFVHNNNFQSFSKILTLIKENKIKYLINFGEQFPFYYPQLSKALSGLKIVATSTLRFKDYVQLPFALNIEKSGTILTSTGKKPLNGEIPPASGAKNVFEILNIQGLKTDGAKGVIRDLKIDIKEGIKQIDKHTRDRGLKLFGEKISFYYLGLLEKPVLKMNPIDASEMGIKSGDVVNIETKMGRTKLPVKITNEVPQGAVFTQPETPEVRGLFEYEMSSEFLNFIPTEVRIWQEE